MNKIKSFWYVQISVFKTHTKFGLPCTLSILPTTTQVLFLIQTIFYLERGVDGVEWCVGGGGVKGKGEGKMCHPTHGLPKHPPVFLWISHPMLCNHEKYGFAKLLTIA